VGKYAGCPAGGSRGVSARGPDPLEAFGELVVKRKKSNHRTVRLRLFPNRYEEEALFGIGLACASLWNEISYEKRQVFFGGELTIEEG